MCHSPTAPMVMCAKCPFECELESDMRKHLNAHHGINDGGKEDTDKAVIVQSNIYPFLFFHSNSVCARQRGVYHTQ